MLISPNIFLNIFIVNNKFYIIKNLIIIFEEKIVNLNNIDTYIKIIKKIHKQIKIHQNKNMDNLKDMMYENRV